MAQTVEGQINKIIGENYVAHFIYVTPKKVSTRLVIPIRFINHIHFRGFDFGASEFGEIRTFSTEQIYKIRLIRDCNVFLPFESKSICLK